MIAPSHTYIHRIQYNTIQYKMRQKYQMQDLDLYKQNQKQLQQPNPFAVSSSTMFAPTHQLQDSGQYISSQIKSNQKQGKVVYFKRSIFCLFVVLVLGVCLWKVRPVPMANLSTQHRISKFQEYLRIPSENGTNVWLDYSVPIILSPLQVQEEQLQPLKISDGKDFLEYVQSLGTPVEFSSKLFKGWIENKDKLFEAEYYRLNNKYKLDQNVKQNQICVITPFRNLLNNQIQLKIFLNSLNSQNYSNFHIFFIDDISTDNSSQFLLQQVHQKYKRINNRMTIIQNTENIGALGNRDATIRNHCEPGDIVVDIDGDDALIGKQVFNLLNRFYVRNDELWFLYFNYLSLRGRDQQKARNVSFQGIMRPGICKSILNETFKKNNYRTRMREWVTSQLRTFKRDLYMSIPLEYIIERGTRKYHEKASDRFTMYAIVELAGEKHTKYVEEYVYFYFEPNFVILQEKQCILPTIFFNQAKSRILTPLKPLNKLGQKAEKIGNYTIPRDVAEHYVTRERKYIECLKKQREKNKQNEKVQKRY